MQIINEEPDNLDNQQITDQVLEKVADFPGNKKQRKTGVENKNPAKLAELKNAVRKGTLQQSAVYNKKHGVKNQQTEVQIKEVKPSKAE